MYKNVASQKVAVFAWDGASGAAKTGDSGNITAQISIDGGACAATDDVNPTELDATDAPGVYIFDLTQAETNGDLIVIAPVSSTANVDLRPIIIYTTALTTTRAGYIDKLNVSGTLAHSDAASTYKADVSALEVDVVKVNGIEIAGAGTTLDPWGPA